MNWGSAQAFLEMGGYGLYVWGAYGVTAMVILMEVLTLRSRTQAPKTRAARVEALGRGSA